MALARSPVKEQILEAATRLMALQGYHRTALDDVLRESGAGKGNFYHYFRSKEDLGYAIVDRLLGQLEARVLAPLFDAPGDAAPLVQVEAFLEHILATQRARNGVGGCPLGNLAAELADAHEGFRQRLARAFDRWRECLGAALARAQAAGALAADVDPDGLARFLVASLEGAILLTKVQKDIRIMEGCVAELRRHLALYRREPVMARASRWSPSAAPRRPASRARRPTGPREAGGPL
jgi:TetR/AcrR family transcriptional repressor of nem operon